MAKQDCEDDEQPKDWEGYFSYRSQLEQLRVQQVTAFDSSIVNLASGALGLSVVLLTALAAIMKPTHIEILFGAWIAFVICIVANLISYQAGAKAAEIEMVALDAEMRGEKSTPTSMWRKTTLYLNRLVVLLFPIGAVLLLAFAAINAIAVGEHQSFPIAKQPTEQTSSEAK